MAKWIAAGPEASLQVSGAAPRAIDAHQAKCAGDLFETFRLRSVTE
jgi:hypothetical protein